MGYRAWDYLPQLLGLVLSGCLAATHLPRYLRACCVCVPNALVCTVPQAWSTSLLWLSVSLLLLYLFLLLFPRVWKRRLSSRIATGQCSRVYFTVLCFLTNTLAFATQVPRPIHQRCIYRPDFFSARQLNNERARGVASIGDATIGLYVGVDSSPPAVREPTRVEEPSFGGVNVCPALRLEMSCLGDCRRLPSDALLVWGVWDDLAADLRQLWWPVV